MNKFRHLVISAVVFLFASSVVAVAAGAAVNEEMIKLQKDLTATNKEIAAYKDKVMATPQVTGIKKEVAELDKSLRGKAKELEDILNAKYSKNTEYADLSAKVKETSAANAELTKIRNGIENQPEIKNMRKEAADLRAKASAIEQEVKKLVEAKLSSDKNAKELQDKKASLADASTKLFELRKEAMSAPEAKALQADVLKLREAMLGKVNELRKATDGALKALNTDEKFKALEQTAKGLNQKIESFRKAK